MANQDREISERQRAYRALYHAAEQIGDRAGRDSANYRMIGRGKRAHQQFVPPQALRDLVQAMDEVMRGAISAEEAFALLHTRDVEIARFGH